MTEPYEPVAEPADEPAAPAPAYQQLTQERVSLRRAAEVFATPDEAGRYPIIVLIKQGGRFSTGLLLIAAGIAAGVILAPLPPLLTLAGLVATVAFLLAGSARAVLVPVPEGTKAVLAERGKFLRVAGPGVQRVSPTVVVTHIVTSREIPFGTFVRGAPTADDVRIDAEILFTFRIEEPGQFVYNTTAPDFDAVCQGAAQTVVREVTRTLRSEQILDVAGTESDVLREALTASAGALRRPRGPRVVVRVDAPPDLMATREARRLPILRTSGRSSRPASSRRVQADRDALARQEAQARVERAKEQAELAAAVRQARDRARGRDGGAAPGEAPGAARGAIPEAARWDWAGERLKVAREAGRQQPGDHPAGR